MFEIYRLIVGAPSNCRFLYFQYKYRYDTYINFHLFQLFYNYLWSYHKCDVQIIDGMRNDNSIADAYAALTYE